MDSPRTAVRSLDLRPPPAIGRTARLELVFGIRHGRTVLTHAYAEAPFRIGRWFAEDGAAHMILASSAPGMFGGDEFSQSIRVERGARVRLTSQSALQVHPSPSGGAAVLRSTYDVEGDLSCEWDPLIPFARSRLMQRIDIRLAPAARLYWSDAFLNGRGARGEQWRFAALDHELRLTRGGALDYLERYALQAGSTPPRGPWTTGSAAYFGTAVRSGITVDADAARALHDDLAACVGLRGAVDAIEHDLALVRLAADSGPAFHAGRARVRRAFCG